MYETIFWIALAIAIGSFIAAAFFFIKDRIWEVVEYLNDVKSGMRSAPTQRRRSTGGAPKNTGYSPKRSTTGSVKPQPKPAKAVPKSEQETVTLHRSPDTMETTDLNASPDTMETVDLSAQPDSDETLYMDDTPDSMETTFISTPSETMETTFIDDEQETIGTIAISDDEAAEVDKPADFQITEKQVLIFSNEVIA